jgi:beta-phosphoglucomutase
MITTVIFDLDGLLADTEPLHCRAYQEALQSEGITLTETEYIEHWVREGKGIGDWLALRGLSLDPTALRLKKSKRFLELLPSLLRPMEGVLQLLEALCPVKTLALGSSSYRDAVEGVLAGLNIRHYFKAVVSGLDVPRVKPEPDIFLTAARRVGALPSECVVLEDAEKGIIAARRAGMHSIAVPTEYTRHHDFSEATLVCCSLNAITLELINAVSTEIGSLAGAEIPQPHPG